jgi:hypothetical protein
LNWEVLGTILGDGPSLAKGEYYDGDQDERNEMANGCPKCRRHRPSRDLSILTEPAGCSARDHARGVGWLTEGP